MDRKFRALSFLSAPSTHEYLRASGLSTVVKRDIQPENQNEKVRTQLVGVGQEEMRKKSFPGKGTAREMAQWVSYDNVQSRHSYMKREDGARAPPTVYVPATCLIF